MGKIAVINHEFEQTTSNLKRSHHEIINSYKKVIELTNQLGSGSLNTDNLTPKIQGLMDGVNSDVVSRLTELFNQTENVIKDYEAVIMNVDTSC
ncbi:hypothetical protein UAY_03363 [Enterococcus moraviensis ATCC BAA-383]|uniref:LXG domain-containing protein n=1 Tax=Enterococcus moraviensis ATCC BAA-383 TaxID=1158609 RepID=R2QHB5_9ENTE|nr:hypothetical protein [Enterococcus moraviensis]EOH95937.1 hypothetical protein UAY_03363 [Enterococcus moraviensis ATCC BAA-383]EOT66424.1 hypothetical protein I586_02695 [Enterococcus moraviensis ATCC BAA-383]OJG64918.1 hypothetical protein RV09_GL001336 [Enterococcus moraviensis]